MNFKSPKQHVKDVKGSECFQQRERSQEGIVKQSQQQDRQLACGPHTDELVEDLQTNGCGYAPRSEAQRATLPPGIQSARPHTLQEVKALGFQHLLDVAKGLAR